MSPNQRKVLRYFPFACAEQQSTGEWTVWHMTLEHQKWWKQERWPQDPHTRAMLGIGAREECFPRAVLGLGMTEAEAWYDAARPICRQTARAP